jgi:aryl-alcohol dehydrogenase-like predicted oxidoreductase
MTAHSADRIALGTVQFGLDYGVSNVRGRIPQAEVLTILQEAWDSGIDTLDTAPAYGDSENLIGRFLAERNCPYRTVTKLDPERSAEESIRTSLNRLHIDRVHATLVQNYRHFQADATLWQGLMNARIEGLTEQIGFSLYYPAELDRILDDGLQIDLVQLPFSLIDRRFEPYLPVLERAGIRVHARSVFLQGLVFMRPDELPHHLASARGTIERLYALSVQLGMSVAALCLKFVLARSEIHRVVIGIDSLESLRNNLTSIAGDDLSVDAIRQLSRLAIDDERITVPSNWGQ